MAIGAATAVDASLPSSPWDDPSFSIMS